MVSSKNYVSNFLLDDSILEAQLNAVYLNLSILVVRFPKKAIFTTLLTT